MAKHRKRRKLKMTKAARKRRARYRRSKGRTVWRSLGKKRLARLKGVALKAYMRKRAKVHRRFWRKPRKHRTPFAFLSKKMLRKASVANAYHGSSRSDQAARDAYFLRQRLSVPGAVGPR